MIEAWSGYTHAYMGLYIILTCIINSTYINVLTSIARICQLACVTINSRFLWIFGRYMDILSERLEEGITLVPCMYVYTTCIYASKFFRMSCQLHHFQILLRNAFKILVWDLPS